MTKIKKILNIEDDVLKHCEINRALEWNCLPKAEFATTAEKGIEMIETAIAEGAPYELLITDMHFPVNGEDNHKAGIYVMDELKRKNILIPTIVCSSVRYSIPEIVGCIFYNRSRDLNWDFRELLGRLR